MFLHMCGYTGDCGIGIMVCGSAVRKGGQADPGTQNGFQNWFFLALLRL